MKGFLKTSIGKKLFMSLTGIFLVLFLLVHAGCNFAMLIGADAYNLVCHFMTNPVIKVIEPILGLGFLLHICYALILSVQNRKARGNNRYAVVDQSKSSKWASRNMLLLGLILFCILVLHLATVWAKVKGLVGELPVISIDGVEMENVYDHVVAQFQTWQAFVYVVLAIALWVHLNHGFWSAFQTIGLSNDLWRKRLEVIGNIYSTIVCLIFAIIPLYFFFIG